MPNLVDQFKLFEIETIPRAPEKIDWSTYGNVPGVVLPSAGWFWFDWFVLKRKVIASQFLYAAAPVVEEKDKKGKKPAAKKGKEVVDETPDFAAPTIEVLLCS